MDFEDLREKWNVVPGSSNRTSSEELLKLPASELLEFYRSQHHPFEVRGWYYTLYQDVLRGKRVLDLGSGLGMDALLFAAKGADVICADIVKSNLDVIDRAVNELFHPWAGDSVHTIYLESMQSIEALPLFDVIWAQGSLINMPYEDTRQEIQLLLPHLAVGGRWIELAYPRSRWIREGMMPFNKWGHKTDGGAPWIEWWDLKKLLKAMTPTQMDTILYFNFHHGDFNWLDLKKR